MSSLITSTFVRDVKWLTLAQLFMRAKGLIIIPLMTHALGSVDYGVWTQLSAVAALFMPFVIWGMNRGFIRYASGRDTSEQLSLYHAWLIFIIAAVSFIALPIAVFRQEISDFVLNGADGDGNLVLFAILFCLANALFQTYTVWLQASGQSGLFSIVLVVQSIFSLFAIIGYLIVQGSLFLLVSLTVGAEIFLVFSLLSYQLYRHGWHRPDFSQLKLIFLFSYPLMPITFANLGINWGDRVVLLQYMTISDIGVYNLSHALGMMLVQTVTQPFRSYYPARATKLYKDGAMEELQKLYNLSAGSLMIFYVPAVIGLFFVASDFIAIMAPEEFSQGSVLLPLLFAGYAIDRMCSYNQQQLEWSYRPVWITVSLFGCFGVNFTLNTLLVPHYGLLGAGVSSVLAFALRYLFIWALVRRKMPVRNSLGFILRILFCGFGMGLSLFLVEHFFVPMGIVQSNLLMLILYVSCGASIYLLTLLLFGVIPRQNLGLCLQKALRK
ncbi:oligosaccharide flippase family protein [uncultured Kiloniella sp.]|uniref:oligosaccharide flippase family protein n=1 Tax=uncultured Kiloniella sp. TaxID=1133091 RepID=UPI00260A23DC|nr:oligosaccharide flippase family protein [uncultured Kiloniella sp.]